MNVTMPMRLLCFALGLALSVAAVGQEPAPPRPIPVQPKEPAPVTLSEDQIRDLIRQSADNDLENDKMQRNYTYVERVEERRLDGKGQVKSIEVKTYDVMEIYGEQVQKLTAKDDKPLSEKDARKEDEKIQKLIDKRRNESDDDRKKRLEKEEKEREQGRQFVKEIADAYNFKLAGIETLDGRDNYVIDCDPRPGYEPHMKEAKFLSKARGRVWIDKDDRQMKKLDVLFIDTVSYGLFLARIHKGSRVVVENIRVNDEVWLQQHVAVKIDVRVALLKNFNVEVDVADSDYKKFRTTTKITPLGEVQQ
ncbi:MAG TPA: hypothetical protein VK763_20435 [Terriglobales bacterium]|jgi:hypothetical protein|nr:hypothetical protein [Terriglobales bacterium]